MSEALGKLEASVVHLLRNNEKVFYASLIMQMMRVEDESIETMGVSVDKGRVVLIYNPTLIEKLTLKQLTAVLEHECLHLVFDHPSRCHERVPVPWNIACDVAINQQLTDLPDWVVTPEKLKMPRDKFSELYYDLLRKNPQKIRVKVKCPAGAPGSGCGAKGDKEGEGDTSGEQKEGKGKGKGPEPTPKPGAGKGGEGSCPHAGTSKCPLNGGGDGGGGDVEIEVECDNGKGGKNWGRVVDSHKGWKKFQGQDKELNKEVVKQAIKEAYDNAVKSRGYIPGNIEQAVKEWLKKPSLTWQQLLKMFVGNSIKAASKPSWKRVNRRFGGGEQKGYIPQRTVKIVLAIDTSGSVGGREFQEFVSEIRGIQACYKNETTVIECDAAVQKDYKLTPYKKVDVNFKGRGGTDFQPVFDYVEEKKKHPDLLIFFTDMYCDFPKKKPPYDVLWVVSSKGQTEAKPPWGMVVKITNDKKDDGRD